MSDFETAFDHVIKNEGDLEENPRDPGGITKYGISLRFLKSIDSKKYQIYSDPITDDDIRELTLAQAKLIYLNEFWLKSRFEDILDQYIANLIFDSAVNQGISPAIKSLQRALWSVNRTMDIQVDGILGEKTLSLINQCENKVALLSAFRSERAGDYRLIAEKNPNTIDFLNGWLKRAYLY